MADLTSLRVMLQRLGPRLSLVIIGLLLFIAGWQLGRVMSPYYAAHPIVFKDVVANNTGDPQALATLQVVAKPTPSPYQGEGGGEVRQHAVAAITTRQPTALNASATFFASKNSSLYHHQDCPAVKQIKETNKISFATREEAEKAGFSPSQCTKQKLGL